MEVGDIKYDQTSTIRYENPKINSLMNQIMQNAKKKNQQQISKIKQDRKMCHSLSHNNSRYTAFLHRPNFNNKTKQGHLIDNQVKNIPYLFIPAYKNETFIMPDRVFQKGKAGKRFFIKMKDTSIYSFKQAQSEKMSKILKKDYKQKTIISRQAQQFNKIIDENDGIKKAKFNTWFLKTRKAMTPVSKIGIFSQTDPILEPRDNQLILDKKISLCKTHDHRHKWRPVTRGHEVFSATVSNKNSLYNNNQFHAASMR